jgi:hypothetical protein
LLGQARTPTWGSGFQRLGEDVVNRADPSSSVFSSATSVVILFESAVGRSSWTAHKSPDERNLAMLDSTEEMAVNSWIHGAITQETHRDFDDLHIDRISPHFAPPENWFVGSVQCLAFAESILRKEFPEFTVAVGFSLKSGPEPIGLTLSTDADLESEYSYITPSLYVFRIDDLPWKRPESGFISLNGVGGIHAAAFDFLYLEYREGIEPEYRRSLWITPHG